ncbi:MAG TPA: hypothetical protein VFY23_00915 [Candidatus Limnocylindrales bacterium]|nr:hypothetical protein [Candidatus Limnocylindrales bacterium]
MPTRLLAPLLLAATLGAAACGSGLSDQAYTYCVNEAPPGELDAAAEALNIAPDADRDFQTAPNRDDPAFQRVCEYAWNARNEDADAPAGGDPAGANPSAPLDPQRSADAPPPEEASPAVP